MTLLLHLPRMSNPGDRLLHYRLVEKIGEGGMGVVWKALDTKLDREIAIKILPADVSADAERLARFEREAKSLAALNHPNVAQVHGLEHSGGTHFLVMEFVPGEDLAERVARGRMPQTEALEVSVQIAAALEVAHERGIVHRDLKPANVRLTPDGVAKVLDFGLAKNMEASSTEGNPSLSPTVTSTGTLAGMILGTAAYMSPEQARGEPVDRRTDIWAFGCVTLELFSGTSPFLGATIPDTLAKVLEHEPDLSALPGDTPPTIVQLIRRCLRKDTRRRLRDIGDAVLEIEDCLHGVDVASEDRNARAGGSGWVWVSAVAIVLAVTGWWFALRGAGPISNASSRHLVLSAPLPEDVTVNHGELPSVAISPNGRWIVIVGSAGRTTRLFLRSLDSVETRPIPDTDGATAAVFSPDSRWIAFLQGNRLLRVAVSGGAPLRIASVPPVIRGLDWARPEEIVLTGSKRAGLGGIAIADGRRREISTLDAESGEVIHNWAQELRGGKKTLITVVDRDTASYDDARILVLDTESGAKNMLVEGGYYGRLLPNDILVYVRSGELLAVRVDTQRWKTFGPVTQVLGGFMTDANNGSASLDFSDDGLLAYAPGEVYEWQSGQLVWVDREGGIEPAIRESRPFRYPSVSPDGTRAVFTIEEINDDVWIYEFERDTLTRLTLEDRNIGPIWRPGFDEICYSAVGPTDASPQLYTHSTDGRPSRRRLFEGLDDFGFCGSWSPDGMTLSYMHFDADTNFDIRTSGDGATESPVPFLDTRFDEHSPRFSPDGKWIAYVSTESGRPEVYIQPFPGPGQRLKISTGGGEGPVWHPEGTELFYLDDSRMMAVDIQLEPEVLIGRAHSLFHGNYSRGRLHWVTNYDVSRDGKRFLMTVRDPVPKIREIRVVQDWFRDVEAKLDAAGE